MNSVIVGRADEWRCARSAQANALWAKSGTVDAHLSLPQHLIDSACVAEWLWEHWVSDALAGTLSRLWGLNADGVRRLYLFLAGTHDVGKATVTFARMREDAEYLLAPIEAAGLSLSWPWGEGEGTKFPHGLASALIMKEWLAERGVPKYLRRTLASVLDAHHGFTSDPAMMRRFAEHLEEYDHRWRGVHEELLESMADITEIDAVLDELEDLDEPPYAHAAQLMTGLVIMADWIASNESAFPYGEILPQKERLEYAMKVIDLPAPWRPSALGDDIDANFRRTFGWPDDFHARPVQVATIQAARRLDGPGLLIIEAPTGVGKTEAGLAAAHVIAEKTGAQGIFLGAPTMATANGLLERTIEWARRSTDAGTVASLYLAHSKNKLQRGFNSLRRTRSDSDFSGIGEDTTQSAVGEVVATQWLGGRKTGLLSDFVVGTVDQLLMLALQARHSMLRHAGLAGKVIIVDEVHAYDAYMSQYLYRALAWLARYGASVVLMSATLPPRQRQRLAEAYASELRQDALGARIDGSSLLGEGYPVISSVDHTGVARSIVPAGRADLDASVDIVGDDEDALLDRLRGLLSDGGVALIICNTIARSQEVYDTMCEKFGSDVELHHAGFVAAQRSEKEDELRQELGPHARRGRGRPLRKVVVATQVAEQSLDIDADLLVTDIAPIDLLIQRAGRLHRHARPTEDRPEKLQSPQILVRGIDMDADIPEFDGGAVAVYGEKLLLATLAHLPRRFRRPTDIERLVRVVYENEPDIPEGWVSRWQAACAEDTARRNRAERRANDFRFPEPAHAEWLESLFSRLYSERSSLPGDGDQRGVAQVRDAEPTVEVVAIESTDYGYAPMGKRDIEVLEGSDPEWSAAYELAMNTVRLPARMTRRESDFETVITELERRTPGEWAQHPLLRGQVALRFDGDGRAVIGRFLLSYSNERGLQVDEAE